MNEEIKLTVNKKVAFEYFLRVGLALILLRILTTGLQLAVQYIILDASPETYAYLADSWWFSWVLSVVPLYAVAFPVFWLALPRSPQKYEAGKMSFWHLIGMCAACFPLMYAGSYIGNFVNVVISQIFGIEVPNTLDQILDGSPMWLIALCTVVIAPIGEELIFRKLLIDRLAPFGEAQAVLFSGLAFGLFHGNFNQFFYAALVGTLFAYVYVKTKNVWIPVVMHAFMNFIGSVVSVWALRSSAESLNFLESEEFLSLGNTEMMQKLIEMLPTFIPMFIYLAIMGALVIAGIIYIAVNARKVRFFPALYSVEGGTNKAIWANPIIIAALALMFATFILYLI